MKYFNKIFLGLGLLGCVGALFIGLFMKDDFGTWGLVAMAVAIVVLGLLLSLPYLIKLIAEQFEVSYDKEKGLTVKEASKCEPQQDDVMN